MVESRRKLAAIMAADVAGYGRLMGDDEQATLNTLNAYRAVFRQCIAAHHGHLVDTAGDSVLAVFDSVVEAVQCAVDVQFDLANRNNHLSDVRRMQFRIGINLGDVIEQADGTIYGDGVNVAARMEALAQPGGICLSGSAQDQVDGKIDLGFADIGDQDVKNIARPVRVFRVVASDKAPAVQIPATTNNSDRPTIAVLPFQNLSGDADQEYFADGIAEDLITELSRLRWLMVTARNSTFTYKGQAVDVKHVGQELGVRYVVEGSVRRGGSRVRITAQLIDVSTGSHLWAERYDRELADMFDLQDEITETLVATLAGELGGIERERARRKPPDNLDAWEIYQRGMWNLWQIDAAHMAEAVRLLQRATELDPNFAQAHAGLAFALFLEVAFVYTTDKRAALDRALTAANKAVALDDKEAFAHFALGRVQTILGDHDAAEAALEAAVELNPNSALAHYGLGFARAHRRDDTKLDAALAEFDTALRLSPRDPAVWSFFASRGTAHFRQGNYEAAVADCQRAVRYPMAHAWPYMWMAGALARLGRADAARAALETMTAKNPNYGIAALKTALSPLDPDAVRPGVATLIDGLRNAGIEIPEGNTQGR